MLARSPLAIRVLGSLLFPGLLAAQSAAPHTQVIPGTGPANSCAGINLESQGYTIGRVTLTGPFDFPWWKQSNATADRLESRLHGRKFTYNEAIDKTLRDLKNSIPEPTGTAAAFHITVAFVVATQCVDGIVDLSYQVYTIPPKSLAGGTPEWGDVADKAPQDAVGLDNNNAFTNSSRPFRLVPDVSFDGWKQLLVGGNASYQHQGVSVIASGNGSASAYHASFAIAGTNNYSGAIASLDWRFNGESGSDPIVEGELAQTQFAGAASAMTRAFARGNLIARFGVLIQGGNLRSVLPLSATPANSIQNAEVILEKVYGGVDWNTAHNTLSISSGGEFGSVIDPGDGYWRKIVGDAVDQFWYSIPDHHPLEVETRLSGGNIPSYRSIPVGARFFGGSALNSFIPGDSWQINSGPLIRAIPANRLNLTTQGIGATSFISFDSTISYPVWVKPLVPSVVQEEIGPLVFGQLVSATSMLQNSYAGSDPRFESILDDLSNLSPLLTKLSSAVSAAESANPGQDQTAFEYCNGYIFFANSVLTEMNAAKGNASKYPLAAGLPGTIDSVVQNCSINLNGLPNDPSINDATTALDKLGSQVAAKIAALQPAAQKKATSAIAFARRTITTALNDLNTISIAPLAVMDWAKIGPSGNGIDGSRFGPGGGIRVELASSVNFTLGYAANVNRQQNEGSGALFFSMGIRDIFH